MVTGNDSKIESLLSILRSEDVKSINCSYDINYKASDFNTAEATIHVELNNKEHLIELNIKLKPELHGNEKYYELMVRHHRNLDHFINNMINCLVHKHHVGDQDIEDCGHCIIEETMTK